MKRKLLAVLGMCTLLTPFCAGQVTGDRLDLYFGDWHTAAAHKTDGGLEERDILTRGDGLHPTQKGSVLRFLNGYDYATLTAHDSTKATKLKGEQQVYFVESGKGTATAGGQTVELSRNIAVLMPEGLEFMLKNSGDQPLNMYVIKEPTPPGFRPNTSMLVRDENKLPITSTDGLWSHIVKTVFVTSDGLGSLESVLTVTLDPLTVGKPHLHTVDYSDTEEVWSALDGTSLAFVGNQLRTQTPGMAFLHIPDNQTPHTNLNYHEDSQVRFLYFARYHPHEPRK